MNKYAYQLMQEKMFEATGGWTHNVILPLIGFVIKWATIATIFWLAYKVVI